MKTLTVKDILSVLFNIRNKMSEEEWENLPIVLGDDEELNGVHEAFFIQEVDTKKSKGYRLQDVREKKITFEEYTQQSLETDVKEQTRINGKCILIS